MIRSNQVKCPACKGNVAIRVSRSGFWQRRVLSFFGIYPWKCGACGSAFLYRCRGHHRIEPSQRVPGAGGAARNHKRA